MKIGIMQPYFFPYIGYWQLINAVDEYVIYDDVNYMKHSWINRNYILVNGQAQRINLHIKDASQNRLIKDTCLAQTDDDYRRLLNLLKESYRHAKCFDAVYGLIQDILNYATLNLADFLANQIEEVCNYLSINTKILLSSEIEKDVTLKAEEKIIDICKRRNADGYIDAIGGKELYHQSVFGKENISLRFLRSKDICYNQNLPNFVDSLSIIDVMMHNSIDEIGILLNQYELEL